MFAQIWAGWTLLNICNEIKIWYALFRNLLQCHHVHGSIKRCYYNSYPQLPPSYGRDPWNAELGLMPFQRPLSQSQIFQVQLIFLQWIPWFLRMSRPGEKITRKTIMMQKKMKQMEQKEISSKSLLANVFDLDDIFRGRPPPYFQTVHPSHSNPPMPSSITDKW